MFPSKWRELGSVLMYICYVSWPDKIGHNIIIISYSRGFWSNYIFHLFFLFSTSLASYTRETGPKVVRGDPSRKADVAKAPPHPVPEPKTEFSKSVSDSSLKFTHILYNLSPAGKIFNQRSSKFCHLNFFLECWAI